jgi:hypothetical protein
MLGGREEEGGLPREELFQGAEVRHTQLQGLGKAGRRVDGVLIGAGRGCPCI